MRRGFGGYVTAGALTGGTNKLGAGAEEIAQVTRSGLGGRGGGGSVIYTFKQNFMYVCARTGTSGTIEKTSHQVRSTEYSCSFGLVHRYGGKQLLGGKVCIIDSGTSNVLCRTSRNLPQL